MTAVAITRPSLAESILHYRRHPVDFVRDHLRGTPDVWQAEALEMYPFNHSISIRSGNGVGKTALAAWIVLHFLTCCAMAKVVVTAPSHPQLHDNLWAEVARWYDGSTLKDVVEKMASRYQVRAKPDEWFLVPRSTNRMENFQGYHAPNLLYVVDEASGVRREIYDAIEGGRATGHAQVVLISNPTKLSGTFYDTHHGMGKFWRTIHVDSEDRARVTRVRDEYLAQMDAKYGRGSQIYQIRVRGNFPTQEELAAINRGLLEAAFDRTAADVPHSTGLQTGVDPAWTGADYTGIVVRMGNVIVHAAKVHGYDPLEVAGIVAKVARDYGLGRSDPICVDSIGIGAGTYAELKRNRGLCAVQINSATEAKNNQQYHNTRTEMYFEFGNQCKTLAFGDGAMACQDEIIEDLCSVQYSFDARGRYQVEPKDRIKEKLGGRSPDIGDALLMACYVPARPAKPKIWVPKA